MKSDILLHIKLKKFLASLSIRHLNLLKNLLNAELQNRKKGGNTA